ncbi:hypothetical protein [Streptomyces sp. NPDC055060]
MDAAWVGAVGVLGGALMGAVVTYFAPLRLEQDKAHREELQRRQTATDAALGRAAELRVASTLWLERLTETIQELEHGGSVATDTFSGQIHEVAQRAHSAVSETLRDEVRVKSVNLGRRINRFRREPPPTPTTSTAGLRVPPEAALLDHQLVDLSRPATAGDSPSVSTFLDEVTSVTRAVRAEVLLQQTRPTPSSTIDELEEMMFRAKVARSVMIEGLLRSITERHSISLPLV